MDLPQFPELSPEIEAVRDMVNRFMETEIKPVMDGYEATTEIRKAAAFKDLPIISLTAKAMPEDKAKSLEAGANDYLTKPVNMDKLVEMMRLWLNQ